MKSKQTQYRISHFHRETNTLPSISPVSPLIVKLPALKKSKDAAVNTIITFKPDDIVTMSVNSLQETSDDDTLPSSHDENLLDHDSDSSYVESDIDNEVTAKEETKSKSIFDEMKLLVFWSCLKPLLNRCLTCPAYATISNFIAKGSMLIVTLFCTEGHKSTW